MSYNEVQCKMTPCKLMATHFYRCIKNQRLTAVCEKHNLKVFLRRELYESVSREDMIVSEIMDQ